MKKKDNTGYVFPRLLNNEKIVVRFKEWAQVRLLEEGFTSAAGADLSVVNETLKKKYDGISIERTFDQTEDILDRQTASLASETGREIPALSGFYHITAKDEKQAQSIVADLKQNDLVAEVYIEPPAVPALYDAPDKPQSDEAPPATPDFTALQGYLIPAPAGVDAHYAWTQGGGQGQGVEIIDVEGGWNFVHEDLLDVQGGVVVGAPTGDADWVNHGTAVQGEASGDHNSIGIVGIAPAAKFSGASIFGTGNSTANAIKMAADKLNKGDVVLIELHRAGPNSTGQGQFGYIAIEWWAADFAAVQYATAKGVIVVAAAGNGSQDLDDAIYQGRFDRSQRDSGAILVGAGAPPSGNFGPDRSRLDFSNFGKIIDAQGWGREVISAGYGDLQGGADKNKWYTQSFSGTSSASPIITAVCASLQGIQKALGGQPLSFTKIRDILRTTGSPQTDAPGRPMTQRIGNRPDLKAAVAKIKPEQVSSGIATQYWIELVAYPPGSARSLWLFVGGAWKRLDNPSASIQDTVQRAFLGSGSNVRVWYDGEPIVGLVVEGT